MLLSFAFAESSETDVRKALDRYVAEAMTKVYATYEGEHYDLFGDVRFPGQKPLWGKAINTIESDYIVEFNKQDNSGSPYTGTLLVKHATTFYKTSFDKNEAGTAIQVKEVVYKKTVFFLTYRDGRWAVTSAQIWNSTFNDWTPVKTEDIFATLKCIDQYRP